MLFSATLTSPIGNITVPAGTNVSTIDLNAHFDDPQVTGTTVAINTPNGTIPMVMFDTDTPQTVANFLKYVNSGEYNNTIIHRSAKNTDGSRFVIQGGGYTTAGDHIDTSLSGGGIPDEFHFSNTSGTVAMAKTSSPNSATSEWFINLSDANSFLDAQNFTVFARVLYNGMKVADAINDLPTVPASNLSANLPSAFPLPIEVAANGTAAGNLVTVTASVVPHVFLSATTDNPNLVNPTIGGNNQMSLDYTPGVSGIAHITVTATDLGGNTASQTFRVRVTADPAAESFVTLGGSAPSTAIYHQPDGTAVTVAIAGPGTAVLHLPTQATVTQSGKKLLIAGTTLDPDLALSGTSAATRLTITTKGGGKIAQIGDITAGADIGTINAATSNLDGDMDLTNSARTITLHGASNGAINLNTSVLAAALKTTLAMNDEIITSLSNMKSITTVGLVGDTQQASTITAPVIGAITVKGAITNSSVTLSAGSVVDLKKLSATGLITGSFINATGSLGAVSALGLLNDNIFAGVTALPSGQPLPNFPTDFATTAAIASVKVKASRTTSYVNTNIAALTLGALSLGRIQTANNSTTFGVAGNKIASLSGIDATTGKKFALHKLDDPAALPTLEAKLGFALQDLVIKLF